MTTQKIKHDFRKILEDNYNYHKGRIKQIEEYKLQLDKEIEEHEYQAEWYAVKREQLLREDENGSAN